MGTALDSDTASHFLSAVSSPHKETTVMQDNYRNLESMHVNDLNIRSRYIKAPVHSYPPKAFFDVDAVWRTLQLQFALVGPSSLDIVHLPLVPILVSHTLGDASVAVNDQASETSSRYQQLNQYA